MACLDNKLVDLVQQLRGQQADVVLQRLEVIEDAMWDYSIEKG
jgi:hypothetical protein